LLSTPIVQPVLIFYTYSRLGHQLTAAKAFTTIALFNLIRVPFAMLPFGFTQYKQSVIAAGRIMNLLLLPELDPAQNPRAEAQHEPVSTFASPVIMVADASFSWRESSEDSPSPHHAQAARAPAKVKPLPVEKNASLQRKAPSQEKGTLVEVELSSRDDGASSEQASNSSMDTLRHLNLEIAQGELVGIVGIVGSGKSSLLSALLGEMQKRSGIVKVRGSFVYCAQTAWIMNATLKENILFGEKFDEERFRAVVKACALEDDLRILPAAEETEIGERGINLSGGQKARVSLARAAYRSGDDIICMLDDPLSAVDAHVSATLFNECIVGLMAGRTRLLVTHHVQYLPKCDKVIVLENGAIKYQGSFQEITVRGASFSGLRDDTEADDSKVDVVVYGEGGSQVRTRVRSTAKNTGPANPVKAVDGELIRSEERNFGNIAKRAYWVYFGAGGLVIWFGVLFSQAASRAADVCAAFWLAYWSTKSANASDSGDSLSTSQNFHYLDIYAALAMASVGALLMRGLLMANHRVRASQTLHDNLLSSILLAPAAFFDVTPIGRILNRFAADLDKVDLDLTSALSQFFMSTFNVLGSVVGIIIATKGTFLAFMVPLTIVYLTVQRYYTKSSTEIQRLESISRSPIFADFSQTLSGVTTIRAYNDQNRFIGGIHGKLNHNTIAYVIQQLCAAWLAIRLDVIGAFTGFFVAALAVAVNGFLPAGWLALALSYSVEMTLNLKATVQMSAQAEADMNSVERVRQYIISDSG
jgi:ATP-binding cassette subfamily C (CFTR/MRP) protein 1